MAMTAETSIRILIDRMVRRGQHEAAIDALSAAFDVGLVTRRATEDIARQHNIHLTAEFFQ